MWIIERGRVGPFARTESPASPVRGSGPGVAKLDRALRIAIFNRLNGAPGGAGIHPAVVITPCCMAIDTASVRSVASSFSRM